MLALGATWPGFNFALLQDATAPGYGADRLLAGALTR
jgi:hypothetical protein